MSRKKSDSLRIKHPKQRKHRLADADGGQSHASTLEQINAAAQRILQFPLHADKRQ
jgi:hypothetical protein